MSLALYSTYMPSLCGDNWDDNKMLKNACMLEELEIPHVSVEDIGIVVISFILGNNMG